MVTNSQYKWWSRGITLTLWFVAAASAAWWGLRLAGSPQPAGQAPPAAMVAQSVVDPDAVARVLGAVALADSATPAAASSRFALLGVVAGPSSRGAALIAVDGKPGRPYRVGSRIEDGLFLQAVEPRRARLGPTPDGDASLALEMPPLRK